MTNNLLFDDIASYAAGLQREERLAELNLARYRRGWDSFSRYVRRHVPAYAGLPGDDIESLTAEAPVLTAEDVQVRRAEYVSRRFWSAPSVQFATSGTKGIPLAIPRDRVSTFDHSSGAIRDILEAIRAPVSLFRSRSTVLITLTLNPAVSAGARLAWVGSPKWIVSVVLAGLPALDDRRIQCLAGAAPLAIFARPSVLVYLLTRVRASHRWLRSAAILLSGGERLHDDVTDELTALKRPLFDIFATQECGLIAWRGHDADEFHVFANRTRVLRSPEPSRDSEHGEPLLFTSRSNYMFPLVNYWAGDRGFVNGPHEARTIRRGVGRDKGTFRIGRWSISDTCVGSILRPVITGDFKLAQVTPTRCRLEIFVDAETHDLKQHVVSAFARHFNIGCSSVRRYLEVEFGEPRDLVTKHVRFLPEPS